MNEFHLDNSEFSWLVYADWLEDQDIDASHIRTLAVELNTNDWIWEYCSQHVGGDVVISFNHVGSYHGAIDVGNGEVGCGYYSYVGVIGGVGGQG